MPEPVHPETYKNFFEDIYQAALVGETDFSKAYKLVNAIYQKSKSVDVQSPIHKCVPSYKLAHEGNRKAVEVLIRFGTDLVNVVTGAASGGHDEWAINLCKTFNVPSNNVEIGKVFKNFEAVLDSNEIIVDTEVLSALLSHVAAQENDYFLIKYFLKTYIIPWLILTENPPLVNFDITPHLHGYNNLYQLINQNPHADITLRDADLIRELNILIARINRPAVVPAGNIFLGDYLINFISLAKQNYSYLALRCEIEFNTTGYLAKFFGYEQRVEQMHLDDNLPENRLITAWAQKAIAGPVIYSTHAVEIFTQPNGAGDLSYGAADLLENYAFWGHFSEAEKLFDINRNIAEDCIIGAVRGGHYNFIMQLLGQQADLGNIVDLLEIFSTWITAVVHFKQFKFLDSDYFFNSLSVLHSDHRISLIIHNTYIPLKRMTLVTMLNNSKESLTAARLNQLKQLFVLNINERKYPANNNNFDYFRLRAYATPELVLLFHYGKKIIKSKSLPVAVFELIATYLSPMLPHEAKSYYNGHRKRFKAIKAHCNISTLTKIVGLVNEFSKKPAIQKPKGFEEFKNFFKSPTSMIQLRERFAAELHATSQPNYAYSKYHQLILECVKLLKRQSPNNSLPTPLLDSRLKPNQYSIEADPEEYKSIFIENYLQDYNNTFFKNPFSSMLKDIKSNTVTYHKIKKHAHANPDSRTRHIVSTMRSQGEDMPSINRFKQAYLAEYQRNFFKNPFSDGRNNLSSITSLKQIEKYAKLNPGSRTAAVLKRK